uniref:Uncharacterized protein n=1 Tax=Octopus bimaculoides TaxID=37653 RepID=A0A0L8GJQ2_OCTBM
MFQKRDSMECGVSGGNSNDNSSNMLNGPMLGYDNVRTCGNTVIRWGVWLIKRNTICKKLGYCIKFNSSPAWCYCLVPWLTNNLPSYLTDQQVV